MKSVFLIWTVVVTALFCLNNQNANAQNTTKASPQEYVEVLYFHGKQRCITCNAIEKLTKEVIDKEFAEQLKNGKVVFKTIDISTEEGEKIADKYEVTWSSLFINKWKDGKEVRNNMTNFGFSYAKGSPEVFKAGVKKKMDEVAKVIPKNE